MHVKDPLKTSCYQNSLQKSEHIGTGANIKMLSKRTSFQTVKFDFFQDSQVLLLSKWTGKIIKNDISKHEKLKLHYTFNLKPSYLDINFEKNLNISANK